MPSRIFVLRTPYSVLTYCTHASHANRSRPNVLRPTLRRLARQPAVGPRGERSGNCSTRRGCVLARLQIHFGHDEPGGCRRPTIHELNRRYLNHDWPTDVLSFVLDERDGHLEGEVIFSADTAAAEAAEIGWPARPSNCSTSSTACCTWSAIATRSAEDALRCGPPKTDTCAISALTNPTLRVPLRRSTNRF